VCDMCVRRAAGERGFIRDTTVSWLDVEEVEDRVDGGGSKDTKAMKG
jgi:hypothetical protein